MDREALGVEYRSNEGILQLEHEVRFSLTPPPSKTRKNSHAAPVDIRAASWNSSRFPNDAIGGAGGCDECGKSTEGGDVMIELDESFRARKILAAAGAVGMRPELRSEDAKGSR